MQSEPASRPSEAVSASAPDGLHPHLAPAVQTVRDAPPIADTLPPEAHIPPPEPPVLRPTPDFSEADSAGWRVRLVALWTGLSQWVCDRVLEAGRQTCHRLASWREKASARAAAAGGPTRAVRPASLAGLLGIAAAVGIAGGAFGYAGLTRWLGPAEAPVGAAAPTLAQDVKALREAIGRLRGSVRTLSDQVAGLRGSVETAGKASAAAYAKVQDHLGKLHDEVTKLQENDRPRQTRQTAGPQHFPTTLDRAAAALERHSMPGAEITGSIPTPAPRPPEGTPPKPNVLEGWTLRRVYDGAALIEGSRGLVEVFPGDVVRGLGRIHEIRREDGRWMVVTSRGRILSR